MKLLTTLFLCAAVPLTASPQQQEAAARFEAASVKPSPVRTGEAALVRMSESNGRLSYENITLELLLSFSHEMDSDRVQKGRMEWLDTAKYDVTAVFPAGTTKSQVHAMLRLLLTERFQLVTHTSSKESAALELYPDARGPRLQPAGPNATGNPYILPGEIIGSHMSMSTLAALVARRIGRPVVDKTDIVGEYDIDLKWTPEATSPDTALAETGDSIYSALREQLGLRLRPGRARIETLVVDQATREPIEP